VLYEEFGELSGFYFFPTSLLPYVKRITAIGPQASRSVRMVSYFGVNLQPVNRARSSRLGSTSQASLFELDQRFSVSGPFML